MQNENAPAKGYARSSVPPFQDAPRGSPISENRNEERRSDRPPKRPILPPKPQELLHSKGRKPPPIEDENPFADPKPELPPSLRPGFTNARRNKNGEDAYDGIS